MGAQVVPPSVLFHIPERDWKPVPAYTVDVFAGSIAIDRISIPASPEAVQLVPAFVVLKSPLLVPAKSVPPAVGLIANVFTNPLIPAPAPVHVAPPAVNPSWCATQCAHPVPGIGLHPR